MDMIMAGKWSKSGNIPNPGQSCFLAPSVKSVNSTNSQRDSYGISYARKYMIKTFMALNHNGLSEQLPIFLCL